MGLSGEIPGNGEKGAPITHDANGLDVTLVNASPATLPRIFDFSHLGNIDEKPISSKLIEGATGADASEDTNSDKQTLDFFDLVSRLRRLIGEDIEDKQPLTLDLRGDRSSEPSQE